MLLTPFAYPKLFLNSSIATHDPRINFEGYSLLHEVHPVDTKGRSACIYYKEFIPLIKENGLTLQSECIGIETMFYLHLLIPS